VSITAPSAPTQAPGRTAPASSDAPRLTWERRRQLPWVAAGVVLIVGSALLFAAVSLRTTTARAVLVAAGALPAGHVLTAADLQTVSLAGTQIASVPAGTEAAVLGRALTVPLLPGSLLTPADIGSAAGVTAGQAVVAVALKPGQYPPMLSPGDQVQLINTAAAAASSAGSDTGANAAANPGSSADGLASAGAISATVISLDATPDGSADTAVASLQVTGSQAATVAGWAAQGQVALVLLPPGSPSS
jgi:hypothetical protein